MASTSKSNDGNGGGGPLYASRALALMEPDWQSIGTKRPANGSGDTAAGEEEEEETVNSSIPQSEILADVLSLFLVRLVAVVAPLGTYPDLSVQSICTNVIRKKEDWPMEVSDTVIAELKEYCHRMLKGYKDVPYHNQEHAHHVVLSTCKLLDMILYSPPAERRSKSSSQQQQQQLPVSYGLRNDPMLLFVSVFAALIHDVEHQGLANRQLAQEKDRLAVLYNDQSIAENWSLYVAFSEFLRDEFTNLRNVLFGSNLDPGVTSDQVYLQFRKSVINLVLSTDIASPERTQIGKSKWKEAFGDPYETVERKKRAGQAGFRRRSLLTGREFNVPNIQPPSRSMNRRGTQSTGYYSELTAGEGDGGIGEEDSLSATPEGSVTKDCSLSNHDDDDEEEDDINAMKEGIPPIRALKGSCMETGSHSGGDSGSMERVATASANSHTGRSPSGLPNRWERRMSATSRNSTMSQRYRQRLGILRTVDISGETIENYSVAAGSRAASAVASGTASVISSDHAYTVELEADVPDTLRSEVLMECIMTAADVAHNLQGWEQMAKWSNRLYLELRKAHVANRGMDASPKWFENQIGFLESYLLPLAHRLEDLGCFPSDIEFAKIVEDNRDRWMIEGFDVAQNIIGRGAELYPENDNG